MKRLPVPGYPPYEVGDDGSVWSLYSGARGSPSCHVTENTWKRLNPTITNGYQVVNLCLNGKRKRWLVHRLVLLAFIGPAPRDKPDVCHNDGNGLNNRLENLRYDSRKGNMHDQLRHGTRNRGEKQGHCKLTAEQVLAIRKEYAEKKTSQYRLAKTYGVHVMNISQIVHRKSWTWLN